jgi:DNA modification methylase
MATDIQDQILVGHAAGVLAGFPAGSIDLGVTSPPYYGREKDKSLSPWPSYCDYLDDMESVFEPFARAMRPNAKLAVNLPLMPVSHERAKQEGWPKRHTRYLLNLATDVEQRILAATDLVRYDLLVWQKQTTANMNGAYPLPGNNMMNNTVEFITIFVKPGEPPKFSEERKQANEMSLALHNDLKQQVVFLYPASVKRDPDLPPPFPEKLPARLIRFFTYAGEVVCDPFVGTGTTCMVAKQMDRRYIGIDVNPKCVEFARQRIDTAPATRPLMFAGRARWPSADDLEAGRLSTPRLEESFTLTATARIIP